MAVPNKRQNVLEILHRSAPSYGEAKEISAQVDALLGYQTEIIEKKIAREFTLREDSPRIWDGLDIQSLQTPYHEFVEMIRTIKPQPHDHWIDLGAAYGRCGVVLQLLCPEVRFTGYEIVPERVNEGNRLFADLGCTNARLICQDISQKNFELPQASVYFAYDFGSKKHIDEVFQKLAWWARQPGAEKIKIIGRGRGLRHWIPMHYPWLHKVSDPQGSESSIEKNWFVYEAF